MARPATRSSPPEDHAAGHQRGHGGSFDRLRKEFTDQGVDAGPVTIACHLEHHHQIRDSPATIRRHLTWRGLITPQPEDRPKCSHIGFRADQPHECSGPRLERGVPLGPLPGKQGAGSGPGNPVTAGKLADRALLDGAGGDDQARSRHPPSVLGWSAASPSATPTCCPQCLETPCPHCLEAGHARRQTRPGPRHDCRPDPAVRADGGFYLQLHVFK
jgi:hypothetical protein